MKTNHKFKEIVGIIGGMGPDATNYFTQLLVKMRQPNTRKDQDHIPYLVYNNPQIPDRSEYILGQSLENPLPELIRSGKLLKKMGATFLVMPCNTSHAFSEEIEEKTKLEVLNMIHLTVKHIGYSIGQDLKVGLLATNGTVKTNIYTRAFKKMAPKIKVLLPDGKVQKKEVMKAIYSIKAEGVTKENSKALKAAAKHLVEKGADVVILGCTEIPLALHADNKHFIDPMEILAQHVIDKSISKIEPQKSPKKFWKFFSNP